MVLNRRRTQERHSIFHSDYQPVDGHRAISFYDLIEVFVAGQLRAKGVSMQSLRKVYARLQAELDTSHPFCRREILTRQGQVFTFGLDEHGRAEMIETLTRQRVLPDILLPFLQRIDYNEATAMAQRWCIADEIVIDPAICLGKPIIEETGTTTAILAACYEANAQDAELVADWYRVHPKHVLAAVAFERSIAA